MMWWRRFFFFPGRMWKNTGEKIHLILTMLCGGKLYLFLIFESQEFENFKWQRFRYVYMSLSLSLYIYIYVFVLDTMKLMEQGVTFYGWHEISWRILPGIFSAVPEEVQSNRWEFHQLGVSKNGGTPKSSILIGFSIINQPFWGTPIFGNTQLQ